jgi:dissimilatory sulfite reductase (desulfoviridin) alpha/beta subunit
MLKNGYRHILFGGKMGLKLNVIGKMLKNSYGNEKIMLMVMNMIKNYLKNELRFIITQKQNI